MWLFAAQLATSTTSFCQDCSRHTATHTSGKRHVRCVWCLSVVHNGIRQSHCCGSNQAYRAKQRYAATRCAWHAAYRLASTIGPHDERERLVELDDVVVIRAKAANALHEHLQ
jgi:ATP-dependent phosphoenolpyruvate carboxykinase